MAEPLRPPRLLRALFDAALQAALPEQVIAAHLPRAPAGRVIVVGAGKAAASMARAVEQAWPDADMTGLVVTRYGHGAPTRRIEVVEAAHPVPDVAGREAARRILELARGAGADDLVLCLMSGGASALLSLPAAGVAFEDKQALNTALLRSGAPIDEMNAVRKRLSAIKGGRLAAAVAPAACLTLLISDVPGDDPAVIGSGPTVADGAGARRALAILDRYGIAVDARLREVMRVNDSIARLPDNHALRVIATPQMSLEAAAAAARAAGVQPLILGDAIEGEAREVARVLAAIAAQVVRHGQPRCPPVVLLSGGETTVTVRGEGGRGGRNSEFALALALAVEGMEAGVREAVHAIACDTDGIDGSEDNAGALVAPDSMARLRAAGLDGRALLDSNDAYPAFAAIDGLVMTGPTLTNVNDFRAIYIAAP